MTYRPLRSLQHDDERRAHIRSPHLEAARYRKSRTITRNAEAAIYGGSLLLGNQLWTLLFGWWLAPALFVVPVGGRDRHGLIGDTCRCN